MRLTVSIPVDGWNRCFHLLEGRDHQRIEVEGIVILDICKYHDHRYDLQGFFYARKVIISLESYSTKKKLHGAMQKYLQEYL